MICYGMLWVNYSVNTWKFLYLISLKIRFNIKYTVNKHVTTNSYSQCPNIQFSRFRLVPPLSFVHTFQFTRVRPSFLVRVHLSVYAFISQSMRVASIPSCVRVVYWSNIWSRPLLFPIYLLRRSLRGIFHLLNALSMFAFSLVSPFQETSLFVPLKVVFAVVHNNNTMKNFHPGFATGIYQYDDLDHPTF